MSNIKKWTEGDPQECDGSAWDRLPPLVTANQDERAWERQCERFYGGGGPLPLRQQQIEARLGLIVWAASALREEE